MTRNSSSRGYPLRSWRLIVSPPARGYWNMAADEAILESVSSGEAPATLRLYSWNPPCLSLGYAQSFRDADLSALKQKRWDLVRRPTGGRAILHTDELTYAVIGPEDEPRLSGGVLESYQRLSRALLAALHKLDIPAQAQPNPDLPEGTRAGGPVCFEVPSHYEITVANKKLIGSAQSRKRGAVLQHGSVPLYGDITRITQVLSFEGESARRQAAQRLLARAATVESITARRILWDEAAGAMRAAFSESLNLVLQDSDLTPTEKSRTAQLVKEKYGNPDWTRRK